MPSASSRRTSSDSIRTSGPRSAMGGAGAPDGSTMRPSGALSPIIAAVSVAVFCPATAPVRTTSPRRNTVTRSAADNASSSLCVISTALPPEPVNRRITRSRSSTSTGASTAVGSSSRRILASAASAFTISSRCRRPTLSRSTRSSGSSGRPTRRAQLAHPLAERPRRHRPAGGERDVFRDRKGGHRSEVLMHHPDSEPPGARGERASGCTIPLIRTSPESARTRPAAIRMSVVFPAPFSPSSAWSSPGRNVKSAPRNACTEPNRLWIPTSSSAGVTAPSDGRGTPIPGRTAPRDGRPAPVRPGSRWRSGRRR